MQKHMNISYVYKIHKHINTHTVYKIQKHINTNTDIIQLQWQNKSFTGNIDKFFPRQGRLG